MSIILHPCAKRTPKTREEIFNSKESLIILAKIYMSSIITQS